MPITKSDVAKQFGRQSKLYASSAGHAAGADLAIVLQLLKPQPAWSVLDVATGAGHTAALVAPFVDKVVATDLTPEMVAEATALFAKKSLSNATGQVHDVESLGFADGSFDAVTCRIAPHHFLDINRACREIARVLKPGGVFLLEDNVSPASPRFDAWLNNVERVRDHTHIRSYTVAEWRMMLASAGLTVQRLRHYRKRHDVPDWIGRSGIDEATVEKVYAAFAAADKITRRHFRVEFDDATGRATTFTDEKVILRAVKV
jgi:ubiquinone/menaquinone biosynthesis C-methylase UbiE